jgi:hypothetical protein
MRIRISGVLLRHVDYRKTIDCPQATLHSCLDTLCTAYPALRGVLLDGTGRVSRVHQLFLNGDRIVDVSVDQSVNAEDVLELTTAIAGG